MFGFYSQYPNQLNFEREALSLRVEQYKCITKYLDVRSHSYGVEHLYAQYQPELQNLIKLRYECAEKHVLKRKL